jgi:hypothetical protein
VPENRLRPKKIISRRAFLRAGLGAAFALSLPGRARGLGERAKFGIGQLIVAGGTWNPRPTALRRLCWEIDKRTSIDVRLEPAHMRPSDPELFRHPFLYLAGAREFTPPEDSEVVRLRRHLAFGGFLVIDSAESRPGGGFDRSVRALCQRLFPKAPLARLADDHVIYKSFYLIEKPAGRTLALNYLEAVIHDDRVVLCYCQNDLGGAWARDELGQWEYEVYPHGEAQRERAFRLGINFAMYALCLDYKTDQVHVPFILKRRRWQSR